jgi:methionyl-tRNA formyltransferase
LKKSFGRVDWSKSAVQIANHVRAMQPWPTAFTFLRQPDMPALRVILSEVVPVESAPEPVADSTPGTVAFADQNTILVHAGAGFVSILRLRPEGKRDMSAAEFQHGHALRAGDRFLTDAGD